jgi:RNA recognition motif-containing protein
MKAPLMLLTAVRRQAIDCGDPEIRFDGGKEVVLKNIYVGNLNLKTTAEAIRCFFEPLGNVHKVKVMLDRKTGLSRGLAFIEMAVPEADRAIATLQGKMLDGQAVHIHEGRQKVHGLASPSHVRNDATPEQP